MPPHLANDNNFLGLSIISRDLFITLLEAAIARGLNEFTQLTLLRMFPDLDIRVVSMMVFLTDKLLLLHYSASMRLLESKVRNHLFRQERPVFTKVKNEAPAEFVTGCKASNLLSSDGLYYPRWRGLEQRFLPRC